MSNNDEWRRSQYQAYLRKYAKLNKEMQKKTEPCTFEEWIEEMEFLGGW